MDRELLRDEVYAVPFHANTLVYAPLTRYVSLYEGRIGLGEVDPEWISEATNPANVPAFIEERGFVCGTEKIRLRLNVTSRCNLRCEYCSVSALSQGRDMPISTALAAVREFAVYGKQLGSEELEIVFSGGEPTLRLSYIQEVIQAARAEAAGAGLKFSSRILTNGLFSIQQIPMLASLFREIQVSWDGDVSPHPRYGLNREKPRQIWANLLALLSAEIPISVLTVVSPENYLHLREIVDELQSVGVRHVFLSLEDVLGRSAERSKTLDYDRLTKIYLELWREYQNKGTEINITGTDVHSISPFPCSVPIPNYSVAPDGMISACTIAFNDVSEHSVPFRIGTIANGNLNLDSASMVSVRRYSLFAMEGCRTCFAKWHCRGGCPYSKQRVWPAPLPRERCDFIRSVIAEKVYATML